MLHTFSLAVLEYTMCNHDCKNSPFSNNSPQLHFAEWTLSILETIVVAISYAVAIASLTNWSLVRLVFLLGPAVSLILAFIYTYYCREWVTTDFVTVIFTNSHFRYHIKYSARTVEFLGQTAANLTAKAHLDGLASSLALAKVRLRRRVFALLNSAWTILLAGAIVSVTGVYWNNSEDMLTAYKIEVEKNFTAYKVEVEKNSTIAQKDQQLCVYQQECSDADCFNICNLKYNISFPYF